MQDSLKRSIWRADFVTYLIILGCIAVIVSLFIISTHMGRGANPVRTQYLTAPAGEPIAHALAIPSIGDVAIDNDLRHYVTKRLAQFRHSSQKISESNAPQLNVSHKLIYLDERTFTIQLDEMQRLNGREEIFRTWRTYDLTTHTQLLFESLFADPKAAQLRIAHLLHDYFKSRPGVTSAQAVKLYDIELSQVTSFALAEDELILRLNLPGFTEENNTRIVSIRKELIASLLRPSFDTTPQQIRQPMALIADDVIAHEPAEPQVNPAEKLLALTFDDGPSGPTGELLDTLAKYNSRATFFVLGLQVAKHPDIVRRAALEKHEVSNHSWNHTFLPSLELLQLEHEIDATQQAIASAGGLSVLMRPPYGATNEKLRNVLQQRHLTQVLWDIDPKDWQDKDSATIRDRILSQAADGKIILLHDIYPSTVDAVKQAIPRLLAEGYQLVTVSELFKHRPRH